MPDLSGLTFVVADDQAEMRETVASALRRTGAEVLEFEGGNPAFARVQQGGVALIVSDVEMPDGDGLEFLGRVRALPAPPPLILVSASSLKTEEAKAKGAAAFFAKPCRMKDLVAEAAKLLGRA